jgi:hypothetical protein
LLGVLPGLYRGVVGEFPRRVDPLWWVVQPEHVLVADGVVTGETDNRFLAVLGEPRAVVDLDIERIDPRGRVHRDRAEFLVVDTQGLPVRVGVDGANGQTDAAGDVLVDEQPIRKEDIGLEVVELITKLSDIAGCLTEDLHQTLTPN